MGKHRLSPFKAFIKYFNFVILLFLFSSCGEYINFDYPVHEEKIFVESYIVENDTAAVVVLQKTLDPFFDIGGFAADSLIRVNGAKATILSDSGTVLLNKMGVEGWKYTMGRGSAYYAKIRTREQQTYKLEVEYNEHKLYATTSFPPKSRIENPIVKYDYSGGFHNFSSKMHLFSDDNALKHYRLSIMFNITLNGREYLIRTQNNYFDLISREKTVDLNQVLRNTLTSYTGSENQKPRKATIVLERISDLYHKFREAVEVQKDDNDTFLGSEVTEIPSNIIGGYGIFTGITRDTACVNIAN